MSPMDDDGWVTVGHRGKNWRHAPRGTPLWEKLPAELKRHVVNFLNQDMLWELCLHHPTWVRDRWQGHGREPAVRFWRCLMGKMRLDKAFREGLCTVRLLGTPLVVDHHYEAFIYGLVRFAWEITDVKQRAEHGAAHVSHAWDAMLARKDRGQFLERIVCKGLRHPIYSINPSEYLLDINGPNVRSMVRSGKLRPVYGEERARIEKFLCNTIIMDVWPQAAQQYKADVCAYMDAALRLDPNPNP